MNDKPQPEENQVRHIAIPIIDKVYFDKQFDELKRMIFEMNATTDKTNTVKYLTAKQVGVIYSVSKVTVDAWAEEGILKKHFIGGCVRFIEHEVLNAPTPIKSKGQRKGIDYSKLYK